MTVYGVNQDGTLSKCRAKPENRGRGRCKHYDHQDFKHLSPKELNKYNETVLAENYNAIPKQIKKNSDSIHSPGNETTISKNAFNQSSHKLAEAFPQEDWKQINLFYRRISKRLDTVKENELNSEKVIESITGYLKSNDKNAKMIRRFLGKEVSLRDFSEILVHEVVSMRLPAPWKNGPRGNSLQRVFLTNVNNDMTKERYVASILFFGGRCCYCNTVLKKAQNNVRKSNTATGEHITPISSEKSNIYGGTRYGNMALACHSCNSERANKELHEWVEKTKRISPENKKASLERIEQFRKYALYNDYTEEESEIIRKHIENAQNFMNSKTRNESFKYSPEDADAISDKIKIEMHNLFEELRSE